MPSDRHSQIQQTVRVDERALRETALGLAENLESDMDAILSESLGKWDDKTGSQPGVTGHAATYGTPAAAVQSSGHNFNDSVSLNLSDIDAFPAGDRPASTPASEPLLEALDAATQRPEVQTDAQQIRPYASAGEANEQTEDIVLLDYSPLTGSTTDDNGRGGEPTGGNPQPSQPDSNPTTDENGRPIGSTPGDPVPDAGTPPPTAADNGRDVATGGPGPGPVVLTSYTSGPDNAGDGYNIQVDFTGTWTVELQSAFIEAADLVSAMITGDVADVAYGGGIIDDIIISAELVAIDGSGGILGQAGPTGIRSDSKLPALAQMQFDSADAADYDGIGLWDDIVLHEMLHSIGAGTIWDTLGLIDGNGTSDPEFNGINANLAYDAVFPDLNATNDLIPVEADGGPGTAYGHWDETTFGNELLTGYINSSNYISAMTVASLEDLGYQTTWDPNAPGETGIGTIVV